MIQFYTDEFAKLENTITSYKLTHQSAKDFYIPLTRHIESTLLVQLLKVPSKSKNIPSINIPSIKVCPKV
jgi:hypothetical protein